MNHYKQLILIFLILFISSCQNQVTKVESNDPNSEKNSDAFMVVDCLLPGQLRKLGQQASYLTARKPIKTSASECEIRGGEYVAFDRSDFSTSLKIWLPKAREGDADAQAYVGEIYEKGLGLEPDYDIALVWYKKAAKQGNTRAQLSLGYLYEKGLGVKADKNEAMKWYRKASGLTGTDIKYSYSIKTEEAIQNNEVKILKAELATSHNNAKILEKQLQKTEVQQKINQQKLSLSQIELKKAQLARTSVNPSSAGENQRYSQLIKTKENEIAAQQKINTQLKNQHSQKLTQLNIQLDEVKKHSGLLRYDLQKNKSTVNNQKVALLKLQEQLASTEKKLIQVDVEYNKNLVADNTKHLNQAQKLKLQMEIDSYQLDSIKKQLQAFQTAKHQQQQIIKNLNNKEQINKHKIKKLNQQLLKSNLSKSKLAQIKRDLFAQETTAKKVHNEALNYKKKLNDLKTKHSSQNEIFTLQLQKLESEKEYFKKLYSDNYQETKDENKKLEQLLSQEKNKWDKQQNLVASITQDKNKLSLELDRIKSQIKKHKKSYPPVIEILDPTFIQVRGVPTISLNSAIKMRNIVGKVSSDNEIYSLFINDKITSVDENGLFNKEIKLNKANTDVDISVIDSQGKKSATHFVISMNKIKNKKTEDNNSSLLKSLKFGQYHALIIGNNDYQKITNLNTAINDAKVVDKVLREKYGFKTQLLLNASRYTILSALNKYRSSLSKDDNLLVYYAGHGELDRANMRGHWLPIDADADNTANWISTVALTDIFNAMSVNHLMVVADSCYSGAMTRSSLARLDTAKTDEENKQWLKAMLKARSRTILTSGGLKPVLDGGGGQHSVFANAFINSLKNNKKLMEGQSLHRKISAKIISAANKYGVEQVPEYAPMRHAGHEAGEFFFVPTL